MKRKEIVSALFLAAAMLAMNSGPASAQSVGGSQSERSGTDTQTPLAPGSSSSGSSDANKAGKNLSKQTGKASGKDTSVGGSQSERSGTDSQTPLPPKSSSSGLDDASKTGKNPTKPSGNTPGSKDTSVGGSQSERSGDDSQTPLPPGSTSSGKSSMKQKEPSSPVGK